ncbi:hypothetical protein [Streptomyces hesseae]|uniref:Uncharacterized protein n=1 Tax=Streptomyces hesseae TaxID=3075519 RepID=A0ABU2T1D5_9ACTN|nr:hypothetical protein [Streptomyces sp. DSM 40473]MDT0454019.1 hypothetical protein [Streptomyces sp. DSM 40473]
MLRSVPEREATGPSCAPSVDGKESEEAASADLGDHYRATARVPGDGKAWGMEAIVTLTTK